MSIDVKDAMQRSLKTAKKEQELKERAQAMLDYQAAAVALRNKTARLRAARLAKERRQRKLDEKLPAVKKIA